MVGGGWVLDFTRLMLISTKVEVGVELGNFLNHGVILSDQISQNVFYVIVRVVICLKIGEHHPMKHRVTD